MLASGVGGVLHRQPAPGVDIEDFAVDPGQADRTLERIKRYLWHGNTFRALDLLTDLAADFARWYPSSDQALDRAA